MGLFRGFDSGGHSAYGFWTGFNQGKMGSCISSKTGLSSACAACFAGSGKYGYDHCSLGQISYKIIWLYSLYYIYLNI